MSTGRTSQPDFHEIQRNIIMKYYVCISYTNMHVGKNITKNHHHVRCFDIIKVDKETF